MRERCSDKMETFTLSIRQRKLLCILNSTHGICTGSELSCKLSISERTVRNDISEINRMLEQYKIYIKAVHGKGYLLKIGNRRAFLELIAEKDSLLTKEDRIKTLLLKLIKSNEWLDLRELEDDMYISKTTLENDLKIIKKRIMESRPYLELLRNGNYVRLNEDEIKKRSILIQLYCENWDYDSKDGIVLEENLISKDILNQIHIVLEQVLKEYRLEIDDYGLVYLILAVVIAYLRILEGHSLKSSDNICGELKIQEAAAEIWKRLNEEWQLDIEPLEYTWLGWILKQLTIFGVKDYDCDTILKNIKGKSILLATTVLNEIQQEYNLEFYNNKRLFAGMAIHIQALLNNMISYHTHNQYLLEELKNKNPFLADIAHSLCGRLQQICKINLGREEENYLLPLLLSAQSDWLQELRGDGIKAAIVSHMDAGMNYYFVHKIEELFGNRVNLKGPYPIYKREILDEIQPSMILTTVEMEDFQHFLVPVVTISPLIDEEDRKRIEVCLNKLETQLLYGRSNRFFE
jgi:transcriptional antiterminator